MFLDHREKVPGEELLWWPSANGQGCEGTSENLLGAFSRWSELMQLLQRICLPRAVTVNDLELSVV